MVTTWTLADTIVLTDPTNDFGVAGRYVSAQPVPALPDGHYLMADAGGVLRPSPTLLSSLIAQNGSFSIAGLPCAVAGTQEPVTTPWRITLPGPDGRNQVWQGVPPTSSGTLKITDLQTGVDGASGWKVVG